MITVNIHLDFVSVIFTGNNISDVYNWSISFKKMS